MTTTEEKDTGLCIYLKQEKFLMLLPAYSSLGTEERKMSVRVVLEARDSL
jgi:hypothetical protein